MRATAHEQLPLFTRSRTILRVHRLGLTCPVVVALGACAHPITPSPTLMVGQVLEPCAALAQSPDEDRDGISDLCETTLARAFAPELLIDPKDCSSTSDTTRLAGGYFYIVHPVDAARAIVRIAYLPAYYADCGWRGAQRVLRLGRSNPHAGDSELIVVEVRRDDAARWQTVGVFLSAHCFGRSDGRCRWYRGAELNGFRWVDGHTGGAPQIWVARDKHANYPSRALCESGHWRQERCARQPARYRFPVELPEQNVGSRDRPGFDADGCVRAEQLPLRMTGAMPGTRECLWSLDMPFRGWQRGPRSATPYGAVLRRLAGL